LQLSALNVEYLVCAGHQPAQIVSLPFVHTARRCYRWQQDRAIRRPPGSKRVPTARSGVPSRAKIGQCPAARGSKSRNKVVVGEPAAGSLTHDGVVPVGTRISAGPVCVTGAEHTTTHPDAGPAVTPARGPWMPGFVPCVSAPVRVGPPAAVPRTGSCRRWGRSQHRSRAHGSPCLEECGTQKPWGLCVCPPPAVVDVLAHAVMKDGAASDTVW
jgi:hypothetical protein